MPHIKKPYITLHKPTFQKKKMKVYNVNNKLDPNSLA